MVRSSMFLGYTGLALLLWPKEAVGGEHEAKKRRGRDVVLSNSLFPASVSCYSFRLGSSMIPIVALQSGERVKWGDF